MALWGTAFLDASPSGGDGGEGGSVSDCDGAYFGDISLNHDLQTVDIGCDFADPVVILGALSYNGGDPSTVRVSEVTSNSFKV